MPTKKRRISAEDLYRLERIAGSRLSADGRHVVYAVERVDRESEKKYQDLWVVPTKGGRPARFTYGDHVDTMPRWSPDGGTIAFVSNRQDEKQPQVHLLPFGGGEARPLTDLKGAFQALEWSPDGRHLVIVFRRKDAEELQRDKDERARRLGVVARHVTRTFFKLDGAGHLPKERWHLWLVDTRTGRAQALTDDPVHDELAPAFTPDGKHLVYVSNRTDEPDLDPEEIDLFAIPARGGKPRRIPTPVGAKTLPAVSPDGKRVAYVGIEGKNQWWRNDALWVVPFDGRGPAQNLTAAYDVHVSAWTINDVGEPDFPPPRWSKDGSRIFFQVTREGNTELLSVAVDGSDLRTVVGDPGVVGAYDLDPEERRVTYVFGEMDDPGQIRTRDLESGDTRVLTRTNSWLRRVDLGRTEELWFEGGGGHRLQGWVLRPPGARTKKKHAAIVEIHGGPLVQYGRIFMHEFQLLAAQGYVVAFSNPRGGRGYGEAHAKATWGAWGTVDYDDVMAFAERVAKLPYVDANRLGVTGGSYGGYMTNWIIGHTDRFGAAVTQRSVSNMLSMWGSSDFNWIFQAEVGDQAPWEAVEAYWDRSPMKSIGNAKTPTLVIHSEQDLRCAIEQGEQIFVALKRLGVPTEMVRFPDEPHGLSRTGRTDRRIERLRHIVRWFDRYLKSGRRSR